MHSGRNHRRVRFVDEAAPNNSPSSSPFSSPRETLSSPTSRVVKTQATLDLRLQTASFDERNNWYPFAIDIGRPVEMIDHPILAPRQRGDVFRFSLTQGPFACPATTPPLPSMTIYYLPLAFAINVMPKQLGDKPKHVTVGDVISAIWNHAQSDVPRAGLNGLCTDEEMNALMRIGRPLKWIDVLRVQLEGATHFAGIHQEENGEFHLDLGRLSFCTSPAFAREISEW
ncbi:hypothetical protein NLI96_g2948 [Meripilus lineatus]|uniref:DUF6699 domain-containing protein n=1 Tax=Meripilus lineatus TaxID=2056292 RepID=A0AAD5YLD4_9APHY|nr:hypothetical protein NLI96_g2948 [Physisporinus lineatus]